MYIISAGKYKDDYTDLYIKYTDHHSMTSLIESSWFKDYYQHIIEEGVTGYRLVEISQGFKLVVQYLEGNSYCETDICLYRLNRLD